MKGKDKKLYAIPKKYKLDADNIDIKSLIDTALSFKENKTIIEEYCKKLSSKSDMEDLTVEEIKKVKEELLDEKIEKAEREIEEQEAEALEQIKGGKVDRYYRQIYWLINSLLDSKKTKALVLQSPAGLGKTYNVIKLLNKRHMTVYEDYRIISGHCTPMDFYKTLYDYQNGVLIIDDIDTIFNQPQTQSLLLQALNTETSNVVEWKTSSAKLDRESKFSFNGKIIILCNRFPKRHDNIMSRVNHYPFNFSYEQRLQMMEVIAKENRIPKVIVEFIRENSNEDMSIVDFRLLFKIHDFYETNKKHWKAMTQAVMKSDEELGLVRRLAESGLSVREQVAEFMVKMGKGRTLYFKLKRELGV